MARTLSELHDLLEAVTDADEVYIQPPTAMQFPCIMIERGFPSEAKFADNIKYLLKKAYTITVVDRAPDSPIPDQVEALPLCRYDRFFRVDGLNHFVFQLYF